MKSETDIDARIRTANALRESGATEAADDLDNGAIAASYTDYFDIPCQGGDESTESFKARVFAALEAEGISHPISMFQAP